MAKKKSGPDPGGNSQGQSWKDNPQYRGLIPYEKGQSGNPGGRPKGKSLVKLWRELLDEPGTLLTEKPDPTKMTVGQILALTALNHAAKGKSAYLREIAGQLYGRPPIRIIHKHTDDTEPSGEMTDAQAKAGLRAMLEAAPREPET